MKIKLVKLKLLNTLFVLLDTSVNERGFTTTIQINRDHIVYTGHFPGYPVTPAVIQMQIVHELLENYLGKKLKLLAMPQCKFLTILNPVKTPQLAIHLEIKKIDELLEIKAHGENGQHVFFKLASVYQFINQD